MLAPFLSMADLELKSPCKINLVLNILGKRSDGFHELETLLYPVGCFDRLFFRKTEAGIQLTCDDPALPCDSSNLVHRAAAAFFERTGIREGVAIHLEKRIPQQAGLGGGSANAAMTLRGLNQLFESPLTDKDLVEIAAALGSDVPFFLSDQPALATGRGEAIQPLGNLKLSTGKYFLIFHFGFGVPTGWAYQQLARHETCIHGRQGRAGELVEALKSDPDGAAWKMFYNAFEIPVFTKFPILALLKEYLLSNGALTALMSGSGSAIFAVIEDSARAESLVEKVKSRFGASLWSCLVSADFKPAEAA